jgi:hypothetical protein
MLNLISNECIMNIKEKKFSEKSVLLIGTGWMANQYVIALKKLKIKKIYVISRNQNKTKRFCKKNNLTYLENNLEFILKKLEIDLTIIAITITSISHIAKIVQKNSTCNILIEKPGALYSKELISLKHKKIPQKIRVGYNRIAYPNFEKLKQILKNEEITSCSFCITERTDQIDKKLFSKEVLDRWGICNTLHVISMVVKLIDFPKKIHVQQAGKLDWHLSGSIFTGFGISKKNIPFSYHGDWNSSGGWGIKICTNKAQYRLMPLEKLYVLKKNTSTWKEISYQNPFKNVKMGIIEELIMSLQKEDNDDLIDLDNAVNLIKLGEKIFGYTNRE